MQSDVQTRARLAITVHLGLDDVKLVLGAAADDLHPLLADLLDQRLFEAILSLTFHVYSWDKVQIHLEVSSHLF